MLWEGDGPDVWYDGMIDEYKCKRTRRGETVHDYKIRYDDSEVKWHQLADPGETWCLISPPAPSSEESRVL